jgi:O-antigen/teichoic acid export membrane protein
VLAFLLLSVAFGVQTIAGRTFIAAAGEKASILLQLVGLIVAGAAAYALVIPREGITGCAAVAAAMALVTAFVSLRHGLRLIKIRYPWKTLSRVLIASSVTAGIAYWLRDFGFHVLVNLTLSTGFYGIMLLLMREWRPRRSHLERVLAIFAKIPGLS